MEGHPNPDAHSSIPLRSGTLLWGHPLPPGKPQAGVFRVFCSLMRAVSIGPQGWGAAAALSAAGQLSGLGVVSVLFFSPKLRLPLQGPLWLRKPLLRVVHSADQPFLSQALLFPGDHP